MKTLLTILLLSCTLIAQAQTPEQRGLSIAQEADARDRGFGDYRASLSMLLRNKDGEESMREMRSLVMEVAGDGDKTLMVFDEPKDIQGTALLTYTHRVGDDDQWLYLPAVKRVKRIASDNKSGPFMGSEFAYEDLTSQVLEKYTYKYLRDEPLEGQDMFVLERYPVDEHSGYTRQLVWLDKVGYRPFRIEYYDRKKSLLKVLVFKGYQQYLGKYWRADELYMENLQTNKSTRLHWNQYEFGVGLKDSDFTKESLALSK